MKPQDPKHLRQQRSAGAALRRDLESSLGWLHGCPATLPGTPLAQDLAWISFRPSIVAHALSRRALLEVPHHLQRIRVTFPRALPSLVGNVDEWEKRIHAVTTLLRDAEVLPDPFAPSAPTPRRSGKLAGELRERYPHLTPLLSALLWRSSYEEELVLTNLRLLKKLGSAFPDLPPSQLIDQIRLLRLGRIAPAPLLQSVWELLRHPGLQLPLSQAEAIPFKRLSVALAKPEKFSEVPKLAPFPTTSKESEPLLQWCLQLSEQEKRFVTDALRAFVTTYPVPLLADADHLWGSWNRLREEASHLFQSSTSPPERARLQCRRKLLALRPAIRRIPPIAEVIRSAEQVAHLMPQKPWPSFLLALEALPLTLQHRPCRLRFLHHWLADFPHSPHRHYPRVVSEMAKAFQALPPKRVRHLGPWSPLLESNRAYYFDIENTLAERIKGPGNLPLYFDCLSRLRTHSVPRDASFDSLATCVAVLQDQDQAVELWRRLQKADFEMHLSADRLEEAIRQPHTPVLRHLKVVDRILTHLDKHDLETTALILLTTLQQSGERRIYERLTTPQGIRTLGQLALLSRCIPGRPPLPETSSTTAAWMKRYPSEFHPHLRRLRCLAPTPEEGRQRAETILEKNFPDPEKLQKELDRLESLLTSSPPPPAGRKPSLEARAANLRSWINSPPAVSDSRKLRLRHKLKEAQEKAYLTAWESLLQEHAYEALRTSFSGSLPKLRSWLKQPRLADHLHHLRGLSPPERKLALRVLSHRLSSEAPPWDFREEAPNARFLQRMQKKGVNVGPWLEGTLTKSFPLEEGHTLTLHLEEDPLEILDMGAHFKTCLSPGGCNYFSVFSNLADVNKRVVYGRVHGQVKARCLLALSKAGTLLVFRPYHHGITRFPEYIAEYAEDLADAMGVVVAPSGKVENLLCQEWYDDGSIDVGKRFALFRPSSPFRTKLETCSPEELLPLLDEEQAALDALTVPYLIELHEFRENPQLILPIIAWLEQHPEIDLPVSTRLSIARQGEAIGQISFAKRVAQQHGRRHLLTQGEEASGNWETLCLLVNHAPSTALEVLRRTRQKGIRSWSQEPRRLRLLAAAESYHRLRRPRAAIPLYQRFQVLDRKKQKLIYEHHLTDEHRQLVKDRLAELG